MSQTSSSEKPILPPHGDSPFDIRHSDFAWHAVALAKAGHCLSIRVIRGRLLSLKEKFSLEDQPLFHAYSHSPLGEF